MPLRSEFYALLADPSPSAWAAICKLLADPKIHDAQRRVDLKALRDELKAWPPEVARNAPTEWIGNRDAFVDELALCRSVREVDLYRYYIDAAATAPTLQLRDGAPAARLERQFTGSLQGQGGKAHRVGVKGQADLHGSLVIEWAERRVGYHPTCEHDGFSGCMVLGCRNHVDEHWRRVAVSTEVEVKLDAGRIRPEQLARQAAFTRRGELYLIVRRASDLVHRLGEERYRILNTITTGR